MSTRELQHEIGSNMRRWQKLEDATVASTGQVMEKTKNPIVRLIMEIIQQDSQMHHRVQEWIADSLDDKTVTISPEELGKIWEMVEQHIDWEKKNLQMAKQSLASLQGKKMMVQEYLLEYLTADEEKHNGLLKQLETIKKGIHS